MSEFAPAAIHETFSRLADAAPEMHLELGGILGDASHTYGYHRARAALPADDYSVVLHRDRLGPSWAASALDLTPRDAAPLQLLTSRLARGVATGDRRLRRAVREFYGTLDGETVYGWDLHAGQASTSDTSHLWHLHLSFYRKHACHRAALFPVADLLAGH